MRTELKRRIDWPLALSVLLLLSAGLLALWSATSIQGHVDFRKQIIWIAVGSVALLVFLFTDPRKWAGFSRVLYVFMMLAMVAVLVPGLGKTAGGAQRWIDLGPFQFQPAEFAKFVVVLVLADFFARWGNQARTLPGAALSLVHVLIPAGLVILQPNLSASMIFIAIWLGMSLVANQRLRYLAMIGVLFVGLFSLAWNTGLVKDYQKNRVLQYFSGEAGFHTERALIAVGSGELIGVGFGRGALKEAKFVPEARTDYIFTVITEEGGFIGSSLIILLYGFFLWRVWLVAVSANVRVYRNTAVGIFVILSFHTLVNLLVVVGVLPVTGVPLPFISYGGSAMILNLAMVGLLLNIRSRENLIDFSAKAA